MERTVQEGEEEVTPAEWLGGWSGHRGGGEDTDQSSLPQFPRGA
jgi:hypothetical protein